MQRIHFFIYLVILPWVVYGQIKVYETMPGLNLFENSEVEVYAGNQDETFESIRTKNFSKNFDFSELNLSYENLVWLKFKLENTDSENPSDYYVLSPFGYNELYQEIDGNWERARNGPIVPRKLRIKKDENRFLPIKLEAGETADIYLKLHNGKYSRFSGDPYVGGKTFYFEEVYNHNKYNRPALVLSVIYFANLFIVFIYVLMLFLINKSSIYTYYLLYLLFQIVFSVITASRVPLGIMDSLIVNPDWGYLTYESVLFIFVGFYVIFIHKLLNIERDETLGNALIWFSRICFIYAAGIFILFLLVPNPPLRGQISTVFRFILLPVNVILIIWIVKKIKHPLMPYFILGHMFFFIGFVLSFYINLSGSYKNPDSIFHFKTSASIVFQTGLLGEIICFSIALALHVRLILLERRRNSLAYIKQLEENERFQEEMNRELDKKVEEKTEELIQVYSEMEKQREKELEMEFSQKLNEMETMALRTQMNPHFLFNSMNAIKHLIMTNRPDDAMYYLDDFSMLLRSVLQNSRKNSISVEEELEILELYLSLEKNRLGENFLYEILTDDRDALSMYRIPSLLLQPFVENAIWHGLSPSLKKEKILKIKFDTANSLVITIEDNGIGREASSKSRAYQSKVHQSMGQKITQDRLALFNHSHEEKIHLKITDLKENDVPLGTLVTFVYKT